MENKMYDICIVGSGVAGMSAAIYAARAGKQVLVLDKEGFGGQIAKSPRVENFPGFAAISGADLAENMFNQMSSFENVQFELNEVKCLAYNHGLITLCCEGVNYFSKTVIIASGAKHRELKLNTKNVYYCVVCDGPFFKGKNVFVIGSGNSGATYALELASYCKNVYLCDVTFNMCCEQALQDRILATKNIQWLPHCTITDVKNNKDGNLVSVQLDTSEVVKCSAIFAAIGMDPQTDFVGKFAALDDHGYIISDDKCCTSTIPNIFVAGDCRTKELRQAVTAASDGAVAALKAIKYVNNLG